MIRKETGAWLQSWGWGAGAGGRRVGGAVGVERLQEKGPEQQRVEGLYRGMTGGGAGLAMYTRNRKGDSSQ